MTWGVAEWWDAAEMCEALWHQRGRSRGGLRSVLTFLFEGEILCQMSTFMVSPQKKECLWVEDFQRPKVQHTLKVERQVGDETASFSLSAFKPTENWPKCLHMLMPFGEVPYSKELHTTIKSYLYQRNAFKMHPQCLGNHFIGTLFGSICSLLAGRVALIVTVF